MRKKANIEFTLALYSRRGCPVRRSQNIAFAVRGCRYKFLEHSALGFGDLICL